MQQLPDWMYHAIEESFACQFTSVAANGTPVGLHVLLVQGAGNSVKPFQFGERIRLGGSILV